MSLRRLSDDNRLRPFLSTLFDAEAYIKNVIKDGTSEECFANIVNCIEDVNAEIKGYISQHKDILMSGMQDVALLAEKYESLSLSSQKLNASIIRMKNEAMESHSLVSTRTHELERIHETSIILHQLKQFVSAKAQLDQYLNDTQDKDVRNLSAAAKTVSELERLLQNPQLMEIKLVSKCAPTIKQFGKNIRVLAQERLLAAISEKNQAAIASSLQVFYNLDSLAEVVLLVVDQTVRAAVDASRDSLDFEMLGGLSGELSSGGAGTATAPSSASKLRPPLSGSNIIGSSANAPQIPLAQLRIAIRELAHQWSAAVLDKATQIHVFQRVVAKKEDPATHERFVDVLRRANNSTAAVVTVSNSGNTGGDTTSLSHHYLVSGQLLELFWFRLATSLHDVAADKLRSHSLAASRAYPYLRRAAAEVVLNLQQWTEKDAQRDLGGGNSSLLLATGGHSGFADLLSAASAGNARGMFGSLQWSQDDLLGSLGLDDGMGNSSNSGRQRLDHGTTRHAQSEQHSNHNKRGVAASPDGSADCHLITGLKPIRDRYLISALGRMTAPVLQMFPELEGYTAAVPSKRDLQTLVKAVQAELVVAAVESDAGLLSAVCVEFGKAVKMMLSKVEGMVSNTVDTRKISSQNNFARTSHQEHNGQLLSLLMQFKDSLEKIPPYVMRQVEQETDEHSVLHVSTEAGGSDSVSAGAASVESRREAQMLSEMTRAVVAAVAQIEELAQRQILDSVVALLSGYVKSLLLGMHREGVVNLSTATGSGAGGGGGGEDLSLEGSNAVQTLVKQMPAMLRAHVLSLVKCRVVDLAVEEICLRTMHSFVSVAALVRPVNEMMRLRTAKDMTALEMLLSGICIIPNQDTCPVVQEFKSFRRLLFQEEDKGDGKAISAPNVNTPPNRVRLFQQDFVSHIRPSTLLGYYVSCGPTQLLSPFDAPPAVGLQAYVEDVTAVDEVSVGHAQAFSVRSLYASEDGEWRRIENEKRSWEVIQRSLDSFFQRVNVADGAQKQNMRMWYEAILDVGSHYFGGSGRKH